MTRARDLASLGDNTSKLEQQGLVQVVATSVAKGASGSASVDSKGNVTFSGTESISLNGCFSSTYDNYRIVIKIITSSSQNLLSRLRTSGSSNTTSNYKGSGWNVAANNTTAAENGETGSSSRNLGNIQTATDNAIYLDINSPFLSDVTRGTLNVSSGANIRIYSYVFDATTSFDGIEFYVASGTVTGTIRVYGYNQ